MLHPLRNTVILKCLNEWDSFLKSFIYRSLIFGCLHIDCRLFFSQACLKKLSWGPFIQRNISKENTSCFNRPLMFGVNSSSNKLVN